MIKPTRSQADAREAELMGELRKLESEYRERAKPLMDELSYLHALKPPAPITIDGQTFILKRESNYAPEEE